MALLDRLARSSRTSRLVCEIAATFLLSSDFVEADPDEQQVPAAARDNSYDTYWSGLDSLQQIYIGFALTTTTRGIEIRSLLERHVGGTPETLHALLADLSAAHRQWVDDVKPGLSMLLGREIETAYAGYCAELYANVARLHETANVAAFRQRYLLSFWSLLGRRPIALDESKRFA